MDTIPLCDLTPGQRAQVHSLHNTAALRRRLLDIGLIPGRWVECVGRSPGGDPTAYRICEAVVAIRRADAVHIRVLPEGWDSYGTD